MIKEAGIWIDHRKAVIITLAGDGLETKEIQSNADKHVRFSGGSSEQDSAEDMQDRQFDQQLSQYYDEVILAIRDVELVLIMGPGEAKGELVKRLERDNSDDRIVGLKTMDKLTDHQIAEKVRQQFHPQGVSWRR